MNSKDTKNTTHLNDRFASDVVHFDRNLPDVNGAIHYPVHPSTQYTFSSVEELISVFQGKTKGNSPYSRQGTPTTAALEAKLAHIEGGDAAVAFATGMAAITAVFNTLLKAGDHIVVSKYLFGNTASFFNTLEGFGVLVSRVDPSDIANVSQACTEKTRLVFVETIANPGTQIPDMCAIGDYCEAHGLLYIVDNTILSPYLFRPKQVKASLVIHSLTKSAAGQGQILGGVVVNTGLFDWTKYPNIFEGYRTGDPNKWGLMQVRKKGLRDMGATLTSQSAHMISLGLETLALRMDRSSETALAVANYLNAHPKVSKVHYPMLVEHPSHKQAKTLFKAGSWLFSFELDESEDCLAVVDKLNVFVKATGLGDTRSLIIPVAQTIFWEMGEQKRAAMNINDGLVRISIGLEESAVLIADLEQALK